MTRYLWRTPRPRRVCGMRLLIHRNTVQYADAEEGAAVYGGHGAALYNFGPVATTEFLSKALFMDNIGGFVSGFFTQSMFVGLVGLSCI